MKDLYCISPPKDEMRAYLEPHFNLILQADIEDPKAWLTDNGARIELVLTSGFSGFNADFLPLMPNLKLISTNSVGYDGLDAKALAARGIILTHTPTVLDAEVATTAVMLYLSCYRNFEAELANARSGSWGSKGGLPLSRTADGRKVGILGLGRIGKAIARKLEAFDCEIAYFGRSKQDIPLPYYDDPIALARDCDALISILPGGGPTKHLLDKDMFEALGPDGVLVNIGRGSSLNETALAEALANGTLGWAGLDVFENEPHIPQALRDLPNTILLAHVGSATAETRWAMAKLAMDNLIAMSKGEPVLSPVPESIALI